MGSKVPADHADCAEYLRARMADLGAEAQVYPDVLPEAVLEEVPGIYAKRFVCPHKHSMWILPTPEQIEDWRVRGVR